MYLYAATINHVSRLISLKNDKKLKLFPYYGILIVYLSATFTRILIMDISTVILFEAFEEHESTMWKKHV